MVITLSKTQQEVVEYTGKNMLVLAGAGSGKTRVLTERINRIIKKLKKGEKVIAITFNNKAADELRNRLSIALGEEILNECAYVGTIHKFCLDVVITRGSIIGLPKNLHIFDSFEDRLQIFKEAINNVPEFKSKFLTNDSNENEKIVKNLLNNLSNAKRNLKFSKDYDEKPLIQTLFKEYDSLLILQGAIDFDDILRYAYQIFTERESVTKLYRKIYKYICVDEAQDLNKSQYEVLKALAGDEIAITMVGDPNQSIYGFNGSTSDYINKIFLEDYNPKRFILNENFRSSKKVIQAANLIENTFEVEGICPYEGEFEINNFNTEIDESSWIVEKIKYFLQLGHNDVEGGIVTPEQCAIIARNRYVFNCVEKLLKENQIEYKLKISANNSFSCESDFIKAFELGIRLIVNSKDRIHLEELACIIKSDKKYSNFDDLRNANDLPLVWSDLMIILNVAWDTLQKNEDNINFPKAITGLEKFINISKLDINEQERILIYEDLQSWNNKWKIFVKKSSIGERSLGSFVRSVSLGTTQISDEKGITLTTVHMSKGLEYDVVFIMGLNEGVFPDYRALKDENQLIEEKHNMFVAITRSKRLCYLTYPLSKQTPWGDKRQQPSQYVIKLMGNKNDWKQN